MEIKEVNYKSRKGVVLTKIQNEYLLVAAKALTGQVPYLTQINETAASCWILLEKGTTEDHLIEALLLEYDIEDQDLFRRDIHLLLEKLYEKGYIIRGSEEQIKKDEMED